MIIKTNIDAAINIIAKDRVEVQVFLHPLQHGRHLTQSLARATVYANQKTRRHQHLKTEEIYHFISGTGKMILGNETVDVLPGDTVVVSPGTWHQVEAGEEVLSFYSCCSPAYMPEDTALAPEPATRGKD